MAESDLTLKAAILAILDENRIMSLATLRPDGWPQATIVGYVHEDLSLYFAVARDSQKARNIERDNRVSIAIGQDRPDWVRGLSMAARAAMVGDAGEIGRVNAILAQRYPGQVMFAPRGASSVLLRATPTVISVIDQAKGGAGPDLVEITREFVAHRVG